jgi:UDP-3-O-[3-hydroxymyristoyl] glucosamine N-acyltransferase
MKLADVAIFLDGELRNADANHEVLACAKLQEAGSTDISFFANKKYRHELDASAAGVILVQKGVQTNKAVIEVADPYFAFVRMLEALHPQRPLVEAGIHATATIAADVIIAEGVAIGAGVSIASGAEIGANCQIAANVIIDADVNLGEGSVVYPGVYIARGTEIGKNCILQAGCVIGADGFGFVPQAGQLKKIPQVGRVILGDNVEIGANSTIDRATTGVTKIGNGVKIDNLVQIGHNVEIEDNVVIAALSGVAGSTIIGKWSQLGGHAAIAGHIRLAPGTKLAGNSGIMRDTEAEKTYFGSPARDFKKQMQIEASLPHLPDALRKLRRYENLLARLMPDVDGDH